MTRDQILAALYEALRKTLTRSGRPVPAFQETDKPITEYEGLDSQCGVEVTLELEEALGLDDLGNNIFVEGKGKSARARTIGQVADALSKLLRKVTA